MNKRDLFPKNVVELNGVYIWKADQDRRKAGWGNIELSDDRKEAIRQAVELNQRSAESVRQRELRKREYAPIQAARAFVALQAETTSPTISGDRFREIREGLGLSGDAVARLFRLQSGRTVRKWEAEDRAVPGPVAVLMEALYESHAVREYFGIRQGPQFSSKSE